MNNAERPTAGFPLESTEKEEVVYPEAQLEALCVDLERFRTLQTISSVALRHVQKVQANAGEFAAILADGSVVSWGNSDFGGDSSAVQAQLQNVLHVQASPTSMCWWSFCSYQRRRICGHLGPPRLWRRQLTCSRAAERCSADLGNCHPGVLTML